MAYFPLFVDIRDKNILIAGGGAVASRRAAVLLEFGARVTVTAPEASKNLKALLSGEYGERIVWNRREYETADLEGMDLALAATDRREVNRRVCLDARAAGIPVNVCDKKEECSFFFPGIAKRGSLVAGITAGGTDHGLARRMTEAVRELFGAETRAE